MDESHEENVNVEEIVGQILEEVVAAVTKGSSRHLKTILADLQALLIDPQLHIKTNLFSIYNKSDLCYLQFVRCTFHKQALLCKLMPSHFWCNQFKICISRFLKQNLSNIFS